MASGFRNSAGVDFDDLYDTDTVGDGYVATFLRRSDGSSLHYASASYGTPGDAVGFRDGSGVDVGPRWAKKGTAQYALPINGQTFNSNAAARGHAQLDMNMISDGTYTIVRSATGLSTATLASGNWLPSGGSVSDYTVQFIGSQTGSVVAGGTNTTVNGATSASALTTTRTFSAKSDAPLTADRASADCSLTIKLFKSGNLVSTTVVTLHTNANGN